MKHLFALIAVCGLTTGIVGCSGEEPAPPPENTPDLGDPGDLTETPPPTDETDSFPPADSGSTTDTDGPEIP
ncbi:MAG: hypothetical protein DWQ34_11880 [Planctomycetota bacterium]|nr:MAG: hypothetical protein DWQ34_11880 [Planctomycetota bacterium]REJ95707.1 MAG: hypothetical protein DWQ29_01610 [Planctomycetota bacterium]REK28084.1 MAG: hypothetical protein DWQ41_06655 [Planctomycetota bacterium]REK37611.1 MAG: hypothetical protein DWQ45_06340 [Planctomycetota bacterium]